MTNTDPKPIRPHLTLVPDPEPFDLLRLDGTDHPDDVLHAAEAAGGEPWGSINLHIGMSGFSVSSCWDLDAVPTFSLTIGLYRSSDAPDLVIVGPRDHNAVATELGDIVREEGSLRSEVLDDYDITVRPIHPTWTGSDFVEDWEEYARRRIQEGDMIQVIPGPTWEVPPENIPALWERRPGQP